MTVGEPRGPADVLLDEALEASKVFVALAVSSLAEVTDAVTLTQWRALITVAERGGLDLGSVARSLGVHLSAASRLVERLVVAELIHREPDPANRRRVLLTATDEGHALVENVLARRRAAIAEIVRDLTDGQRTTAARAFRTFHRTAHQRVSDAERPGGSAGSI